MPKVDRDKYQKLKGVQSDYFNGRIDSVYVINPDVRRWFDDDEFVGELASVDGLDLSIYRDKRIRFDENQRPQMLQDLLRNSNFAFHIDSLMLKNSNISYTEQPANTDKDGRIRFSSVTASVIPLSNIKAKNTAIPDFELRGRATVMDSCQLNTVMKFKMNDVRNSFTADGVLSPFNMAVLNPVLEPLASMSVRSGRVNDFRFSFNADDLGSNGNLYFGYNDLKIAVLEKKNGNTKEAKFASFLANSLLLRSKNPRGKELSPDEISFRRDPSRSTISYVWKSVFSGIKNTLGIKDNKQEPEQ